jgi:hypothetical protein
LAQVEPFSRTGFCPVRRLDLITTVGTRISPSTAGQRPRRASVPRTLASCQTGFSEAWLRCSMERGKKVRGCSRAHPAKPKTIKEKLVLAEHASAARTRRASIDAPSAALSLAGRFPALPASVWGCKSTLHPFLPSSQTTHGSWPRAMTRFAGVTIMPTLARLGPTMLMFAHD